MLKISRFPVPSILLSLNACSAPRFTLNLLKISRFLVPSLLLSLNACFAPRYAPVGPEGEAADTLKVASDTLQVFPDTLTMVSDTLKSFPDTLPTASDTTLTTEGVVELSEAAAKDAAGDTALIPGVAAMADSTEISGDTVTIIGTGDIMPGSNFPDNRYLPPGNDCSSLFAPVTGVLKSADVTFGNLEGVFSSEGGTAKNCKDPEVCYVFRMPDAYLDCILEAGYNLLSVANNHVNDFGYEGRMYTAKLLDEAGVPFAGFLSRPSVVFEAGGHTIGFAAFAPNIGTVDLKDYAGAARIVAGLDSVCDIVIVSFHGGAEGRDYQHTPCTDETYLGYNRGNVCKLAHTVVDAGADVVFGHGPHVTRAMELYKDRLICYSLGNFCTYRRFNLSGPNGIAPIVKVHTDREGRFLGGQVVPVYQPGAGGPRIDPHGRAITALQELGAADFPDNELVIDNDGRIYKR
jgi:hypothetical protein